MIENVLVRKNLSLKVKIARFNLPIGNAVYACPHLVADSDGTFGYGFAGSNRSVYRNGLETTFRQG